MRPILRYIYPRPVHTDILHITLLSLYISPWNYLKSPNNNTNLASLMETLDDRCFYRTMDISIIWAARLDNSTDAEMPGFSPTEAKDNTAESTAFIIRLVVGLVELGKFTSLYYQDNRLISKYYLYIQKKRRHLTLSDTTEIASALHTESDPGMSLRASMARPVEAKTIAGTVGGTPASTRTSHFKVRTRTGDLCLLKRK